MSSLGNKSRSAWFEEARFGLFVHWNACAGLEGRYCGEPVRQTEYGEWLYARNRVRREDWDAAVQRLSITPERVEAWAQSATDAGMKYLIFVAKHHDGLAYWPSDLSDYTLNNLAGVDFDVIACLKEACDKRRIKLGLYYSHWHDWEHPFGWGNFWHHNSDDPKQFDGKEDLFFYGGQGFRDNLSIEQFDEYWRTKSMPQVEELIHNYDPDLLWFDCWMNFEDTIMSDGQVRDMLSMIRRLCPKCVVNSRLGLPVGKAGTDYETAGDNEFPDRSIGHPWESPVTFGLSWGYNRDDQNWRPASYFIRNLVRNIGLGGNLAINYGPMADGTVPEEAAVRIREIGRCLAANGEGFHGCGITPFEERSQDWGLTTCRDDQLFLHVFDWPVDGVVRVNGILTLVKSAWLCAEARELELRQVGSSVHVFGPRSMPCAYDTVIRLDLDGVLTIDNETLGEINCGGIPLQASRATLTNVALEEPVPGSTKLPAQLGGWSNGSSASWAAFVPEAGLYEVLVCYSCSSDCAGQEFAVSVGDRQLVSETKATMSNWSEFRPFSVGRVEIGLGKCEIHVRPVHLVQRELFKLLWVHLASCS